MDRENITGEIRTVDDNGALVRIVEHTAAGSIHAGGWLTRYYKTEDGEPCEPLDDGDFIETTSGRLLTRIKAAAGNVIL